MNTNIAGVILAGGRGSRLGGVEKSAMDFAGTPVLSRVYDRVATQADIWVLASDGYRPDPCPPELTILDDPFNEKLGPLAGILAAYNWLKNREQGFDYLLCVPVDTPFFPKDFAARAFARTAQNNHIAIGAYGSDQYPTAALWPMADLDNLGAWLAETDNLAIRAYMANYPITRIDYSISDPDANPFDNINRPADIMQLEGRLTRS